MRCPRPCRARKATRFPSRVPSTIASEGSPNGVFTRISRVSVSPLIAYSPLPPMMPIVAWAADFALLGLPAFFGAIFFSPLAVKAALLQYLIHRGKWILLAVRHLCRQFGKPRLSTRSAQSPLEQTRFEQFDQTVLPMLDVFSLSLPARFKMFLKFGNRLAQLLNTLVLRSHRAHHGRVPAVPRHHQRQHSQQLL